MHRCRYLVTRSLAGGGWVALNGLSGAVDLLDEAAKETLDSPPSSMEVNDPELLSRLRRRGYLFGNPEEEERLLLAVWERQRDRAQERPFSFAICPTHSCNLACRYCFEGDITRKPLRVLSSEALSAAFQAMDQIAAQQPTRQREVNLFGGEPLLPATFSVVKQALREAEHRGMGVGVVTNGSYLTTTYHDLIVESRHLFSHFQITVDGPQSIHDTRRPARSGKGSYQQAMEGVDFLVGLDQRVALRVNLDAHNVRHLPELAAEVAARGWLEKSHFRCVLAPVIDHLGTGGYDALLPEERLVRELAEVMEGSELTRKMFKMDLFRSAKQLGSVLGLTNTRAEPMFQYCEANGLHSYTFGADGYIYPCSEMLDQPELAIGTFFPTFNLDADKSAPWLNRSILAIPECRECTVATFCGGGCAYRAMKEHGTPLAPACYGAEEIICAFVDCFNDRLVPQPGAGKNGSGG